MKTDFSYDDQEKFLQGKGLEDFTPKWPIQKLQFEHGIIAS